MCLNFSFIIKKYFIMLSVQNLVELAKKKAPLLLGLLALTVGVVLYFVKYRKEAFNINFNIKKQENEKRVGFADPPVQQEVEMQDMAPQHGGEGEEASGAASEQAELV